MLDFLCDVEQQYIPRENFIEVFEGEFGDKLDEFLELAVSERCIFLNEFVVIHKEDSYYIMHMDSLTVIGWYKHLGRACFCNKHLSIEDTGVLVGELYTDYIDVCSKQFKG